MIDMGESASTLRPAGGDVVRRHRLSTRVWHWVNVVAFLVMLMSGLMIFNAHPRLYWGQYGAHTTWLVKGPHGNWFGCLFSPTHWTPVRRFSQAQSPSLASQDHPQEKNGG